MSKIELGKYQYRDYRTFISGLIALMKPQICLEVGVSRGETSVFMAQALNSSTGCTLHGFDNWSTHGLKEQFSPSATKQEVEEYIKSLGIDNIKLYEIDLINQHEKFKEILLNITSGGHNPIDLAFIDGCHSYVGVKKDFDAIYPLLSKNSGTIIFHDTLMIDGCREFMFDLRTKYNDGTYDIIDFSFGQTKHLERIGISMLTKRSFPITDRAIEQVCGSISKPEIIERNETKWIEAEIKKHNGKKTHLDYDYNTGDMDSCLSPKKPDNYRLGRKRGDKWQK